MTETHFIFLFLAVFLIELGARATFLSVYYKFGIPIFQKSILVIDHAVSTPHSGAISQHSSESNNYIYTLRQIDSFSVGIKEAFPFEISIPGIQLSRGGSYTPVLHGVITFNPSSSKVSVRAHLNWYMVMVVLGAYHFFKPDPNDLFELIFPLAAFVIASVIAFVQIRLYKKLLSGAAISWSNPSFNPDAASASHRPILPRRYGSAG